MRKARTHALSLLALFTLLAPLFYLAPTAGATPSPSAPTLSTSHKIHIFPVHGSSHAHAAGLTTLTQCNTPDCPPAGYASMTYQGGPIVTTPKVYLVRFSDTQGSLQPAGGFVPGIFASSEPNGAGAINAVVNSSALDALAAEYDVPSKGYFIQHGSFAGVVTLYNPTLADATTIDDTQITAALRSASYSGQLPSYDANSIFVAVFRSNQVVTINASGIDSTTGFCGYHSWVSAFGANNNVPQELNYVVLPNEAANPGCSYSGQSAIAFDNWTPVLAHELMEVITDPAISAWFNAGNSWEIGDLCEYGGPVAAQLPGSTYNYFLQYEFSNLGANCILTKPAAVLTASYSSPSNGTATISTYLANAGTPITNAQVLLVNANGIVATATTDQDGNASFPNSPLTGVSVFYAGNAEVAGLSTSPGTPPLSGPTLMSATPGNAQITATWQAPSYTSGQIITGYVAVAIAGTSTLSCSTTSLACTITGLQNGTNYLVSVSAVTAGGLSPASNTLAVTPATVPSAPSSLTATPGNARIYLTWTAPAFNGGAPLTGYQITDKNLGSTPITTNVGASTTSYTLTGLQNGLEYSVTIVALNAMGSSPNLARPATPTAGPGSPTSLTAAPGAGSITPSWSAATPQSGYPISEYVASATDGTNTFSCTTTTLTCTITGLSPSVSYSLSVVAIAADGTSDPAVLPSVYTLGPPSAPDAPSVTALNNTLNVSWSATNATSYTAYAFDGSSTYSCTTSSTSCFITGLTNNTSYSVYVVAANAYGSSVASPSTSASPAPVFTWSLSAPTSALVGSHPSVTLQLNPGLPTTTLPASGTPVTLLVNGISYTAVINSQGVATFTPLVGAGTNQLSFLISGGTTLASPTSSAVIAGLYGFGGYSPSTLSAGSTSVSFELLNAAGTMPAVQATGVASTNTIGLRVTSGPKNRIQICSYTAPRFTCANTTPYGLQTFTVVQFVGGAWVPLLGVSSVYLFGTRLTPGHGLAVGQSLYSANGLYHATLLRSGVLAVYGPRGLVWRSTTSPTPARQAWLRGNGALYLIGVPSGRVYWHVGAGGTHLDMQGDGNLVLYAGTRPIWHSR